MVDRSAGMARYRLGAMEIDLETREVRQADGTLVNLEPRAFAMLAYLVSNPNRVVTKEELLDAVWDGRVVTDGVLRQAVAKVRRALGAIGDDAVTTVPKVGYRLTASPQLLSADTETIQKLQVLVTLRAHAAWTGAADLDPGIQLLSQTETLRTLDVPTPSVAVTFALKLQRDDPTIGIGIHVAERATNTEEQQSADLVEDLAELASAGQVLLSPSAYELARANSYENFAVEWRAHGDYRFDRLAGAAAVYQVGEPNVARFEQPSGSSTVVSAVGEAILGWRPAKQQLVPQRTNWELIKPLGTGGFGEAWLAEHTRTREQRVFKFCFREDRLRSLQREVTLFRLLKETLGERRDIARILDWNFKVAPFFVESEYTADGDLTQWFAARGGFAHVSMEERLTLLAGTARALAVAHSVGVLHKDVKPSNILVRCDAEEPLGAVLADFGIGLITDASPLEAHDITALGMTGALTGSLTTSRTGTRRYTAPELLEGNAPTAQADIYSLGVVLYQLVVGDFDRVLAPGWERDVDDELLREDIAAMVEGDPQRRIDDLNLMAQRISSIDSRRAERQLTTEQDAKLQREQRRRHILVPTALVAIAFAAAMAFQSHRIEQQAELAQQEARRANAVSKYLTNVFDSANPYRLQGSDLSAEDLLDVGARSLKVDNNMDPASRASLLLTMGRAYSGIMNFAAAESMFDQAETIVERDSLTDLKSSLFLGRATLARRAGNSNEARQHLASAGTEADIGTDRLRQADVLDEMAEVESQTLNHEAALPLLNKAVALRETLTASDNSRLLESQTNLAQTLSALGQHEQAAALFESVIEAYGEDQPGSINAQQFYSTLLIRMDEIYKAWQHADHAYRKAQQFFPEDHPALADAAVQLANVLTIRGMYEEAEALQKGALAIRQAAFGEHPKTAESVSRLAHIYMNTGDAMLAKQYYEETFRLNEAIYGENNSRTAAALVDYAILLFEFPEAYPEAVQTLERATAMFAKTNGSDHWSTGVSHVYLSRAYFLADNFDRAAVEAELGVNILEAEFPEGGYRPSLARLQLASAWFRQNRVTEARAIYDEHFPVLAEHRDTDADDYQIALALYDEIKAASD